MHIRHTKQTMTWYVAESGAGHSHEHPTTEVSSPLTSVLQRHCDCLRIRWVMACLLKTFLPDVQGVNSSLYVYQEVLEGCNELVTAEEYSSLGQVESNPFTAALIGPRMYLARLACCPGNARTAQS